MMFRKQWGAASLLLIGALMLAACGSPTPTTPEVVETNPLVIIGTVTPEVSPLPTPGMAASPLASPGAELADVSGLIAALEAAGATVETGDKIEQPFFEVQGQILKVNGQSVEVFEWADEASREAVSRTITPQGQFGTTQVEWVGKPHFWASGKIIALYVGDNAEVVELLTGALGAPITQE
jgi:hypothetical protein